MIIDMMDDKALFIQIAEQIEDAIFTQVFKEEERIPSTTEYSQMLNINPRTVLKGMNLLVNEDIIYKQRGLGMYVKKGALEKIKLKRQSGFYEKHIVSLVLEAKKLNMSKEEIVKLIERSYQDE